MRLYYLLPKKDANQNSPEKTRKIKFSLLKHVYAQAMLALLASLFCAAVVFMGLYDVKSVDKTLIYWAIVFIIITVLRAAFTVRYQLKKYPETDYTYWRNLYILGSILGGLSWGLAGVFLLPNVPAPEQMLLIMVLAGVTAGAVPISAPIPLAAICFISFAIVPFIVSFIFSSEKIYFMFNLTMTVYLFYLISLALRAYRLIRNTIVLRYENDLLLNSLELTNQKLAYAATHDSLTLVPNRRMFSEKLENTIKEAKVNKSLFALLYLDLDHFKEANDKFGHHVGDQVLVAVFARLKAYFKRDDILARMGGDEIAIILPEAKTKMEIEKKAQEICDLVAQPIEIDHHIVNVSASIGISIYPYDGSDEETLIHLSDKNMYYAKKRGGNNFHLNQTLEKQT